MQKFFFWLEWPRAYRFLYSFLLLLFLALNAYMGYTAWRGDKTAIQWQTEASVDLVKIPLDGFSKHFFDFVLDADAYLMVEKFLASDFQLQIQAYQLQTILVVLGLIVILTAIPDLAVNYYGIGLGFVAICVSAMNMEYLRVLPSFGERFLTLASIGALGSLSYVFRSYWPEANYVTRFLSYLLIVAGIAASIYLYSPVTDPLMHIACNGMVIPLIACGAFFLFNGHEMMRVIFFLATATQTSGKGNAVRFGVLFSLYFGNILYAFFHLRYGIDWGIYYLHPALLAIMSAVICVWGLKFRAEQIKEVIAFAPTASFIYLGTGIIAFSTMAFAYSTANDALYDVLNDIVLSTHGAMAMAMLAYISINFLQPLLDGLPAYKVFYKPNAVQFSMAWIFGFMLAGGMQFENGFAMYRQGFAAYYTLLGDADWAKDDVYSAKQYYGIARTYTPLSHRIHYTLGSLARKEQLKQDAYIFFKEAQAKRPSPHAYANMAALNEKQGFSFDALFDLRRGLRKFPQSGELLNNMGLLMNQTQLADSAFIYFQLARERGNRPEVAEANLFSLWTKYNFSQSPDVFYGEKKPIPYINTEGNELAYLSKIGKTTTSPFNWKYLSDTVLTTAQLCYVYNYAINTANTPDSALIAHLQRLQRIEENAPFDRYINFAVGHMLYKKGDYRMAFLHLVAAKESAGHTNGYFPNLIGLRLLEHDKYEEAAQYFQEAVAQGNEAARLNLAIVQSEFDREAAIETWKQLRSSGKPEWAQPAGDLLALMVPDSLPKLPLQEKGERGDLVRYRYLHYQREAIAQAKFDEVWKNIDNPDLRIIALSERANFYMDKKDMPNATLLVQLLAKQQITNQTEVFLQMAYLRLVYEQGTFDEDFKGKAEEAAYPVHKVGLKPLYLASYYAKNKQYAVADRLYQEAIAKLPFAEAPYLGLAQMLKDQGKHEDAYQALLKGTFTYPNSPKILQAYILNCLELRYDSYSEYALEDLKKLLPAADYQAFLSVYQLKKADMEKQTASWQ